MKVTGFKDINLTSHFNSFFISPILWLFSLHINFIGKAPWGYDSNSALISSFSYPSFLILNLIEDSNPKGTIGNINSLLSKYNLGNCPSPSSLITLFVIIPSESTTLKVTCPLYSF